MIERGVVLYGIIFLSARVSTQISLSGITSDLDSEDTQLKSGTGKWTILIKILRGSSQPFQTSRDAFLADNCLATCLCFQQICHNIFLWIVYLIRKKE
jgi:hypothetical protein